MKDVEIGILVIAAGVYHARLKAEVKPNNAGSGNNLKIVAKILDGAVVAHKTGQEVTNKGQIMAFRHVSLVPTDDYDPDKVIKELGVAVKLPVDADVNVEDLDGKIVMIKLSVEKESTDEKTGKVYPEKNNIDRFTPVKDDDTFTEPPF